MGRNLILKGKAYYIIKPDGNSNDINTDYIISGRYKFHIDDIGKLAEHIFEDIDPDFLKKFKSGNFIVSGNNFGCGSSREQAPLALKYAGVSAVIAKSFARIFYRNCFNIGLPLIECNTEEIHHNDLLTINLNKGVIKNETTGNIINICPLPKFMISLLKDGGLVKHIKKRGKFELSCLTE